MLVAAAGAVAVVWAAFQFRQLLHFRRWLDDVSSSSPLRAPPSFLSGAWRDTCRSIRRLQSEAPDARARLEDGVVALPYGFVIVARNGQIKWFNAAAAELLRLSNPSDIGQEIQHLMRQPEFLEALESGSYSTEVEIQLSGKSLAIHVTTFGAGEYRLIVVHDVTHMRYLERVRSELLGHVAHELKTPLTVIHGYAEIIAAETAELGALFESARVSKSGEAAEHIVRQAGRMDRLVNDLLMLERLEEDRASVREQVKLRRLADEIAVEADIANPGKRCRIEVAVERNATLTGNRIELHSVLSNLVSNAIRHSPEDGVVRIAWARDSGGGHLSVSDEGVGIDPVHLPRLTERFYRADKSRSHELGGTGLGLAIVKRVLQRHGASLHIESEPGKGSTFRCDFPPG